MDALSGLSDDLLLAPQDQDVYVEEAAAAIASSALPADDSEVSEETCVRLARVVQALDRKVRNLR
jgi:hypothetical protein